MAIHTITIPDWQRGDELRSIVWDDEAGTVNGEHSLVPDLRRFFDAPKPITVGDPGGTWDLRDPAHNPVEFLTLLGVVFWPVLGEPLRSTMPAVFDGIKVPWPDPDTLEELWTIDSATGWYVHPRTGDLVDPATLS
ncbi:hypothetical protein F4212_04950 [Candidatus Poribacteria bacterium]|nr:hypothetical protein [Candidatus Poribacteria bacterium]